MTLGNVYLVYAHVAVVLSRSRLWRNVYLSRNWINSLLNLLCVRRLTGSTEWVESESGSAAKVWVRVELTKHCATTKSTLEPLRPVTQPAVIKSADILALVKVSSAWKLNIPKLLCFQCTGVVVSLYSPLFSAKQISSAPPNLINTFYQMYQW